MWVGNLYLGALCTPVHSCLSDTTAELAANFPLQWALWERGLAMLKATALLQYFLTSNMGHYEPQPLWSQSLTFAFFTLLLTWCGRISARCCRTLGDVCMASPWQHSYIIYLGISLPCFSLELKGRLRGMLILAAVVEEHSQIGRSQIA